MENKKGVVLAIGSVNGVSALGDPGYSAAKSGLMALTRSITVEYGRFGVRANAVLPGTVRTPIWDERRKKNPEVLRKLERWYPLGRIAEPEEVAEVAFFSCLRRGQRGERRDGSRRLRPVRRQHCHDPRTDRGRDIGAPPCEN